MLFMAITNEPQPAKFYRIDLPMVALTSRNNHQGAVTIQAGEIFEVVGRAQDERFVVAKVRGEQVLIFDYDLKDRGKPVHGQIARGASGGREAASETVKKTRRSQNA